MPAMSLPEHIRAHLEDRLAALGLSVPEASVGRLLHYLELLLRWNTAYNLTAVREPLAMVDRHLIDALSILPFVRAGELADVGTGPGIPGLVLALIRPFERLWLIDSNGKKARFLRECVRSLGVAGVTVVQARAETLAAQPAFPLVVSRAYADLSTFVLSTRGLLARGGRWLAMKGRKPEAEIAALPAAARLVAVHRLAVPGAAGERHLLEIVREE
jgi:16S rRNA (guanine527-N7)-methyltransferase